MIQNTTFFKYKGMKKPALVMAITMVMLIIGTISVAADPPLPDVHFITGEALYDGSTDANGAAVTVMNQRTGEELYDIVGTTGDSNTSGYYLVDLADLTQGFSDGDQIHVVIIGTDGYQSYYGENTLAVDKTAASQILNVNLVSDVVQPDLDDNTPAAATTGDAFTFTATVTDTTPITNVELDYWYGDGTHTTTGMTQGGSTYTASIIIPDAIDTLHYIITANDTLGNQASTGTKDVTITDNDSPVITLNGPTGTITVTTAIFTWTATDNVDDPADITYRYRLDDDSWSDWDTTTKSATYTSLSDDSSYTFRVEAQDTSGNIASKTKSFTVDTTPEPPNDTPVADFTYTQSQNIFNFDATDSYDTDGEVVNWTWTFGDETQGYGEQVTHEYDDKGDFQVTLKVKDDDGASDQLQVIVTVSNQAPSAYFTYEPAKPDIGEEIVFTDASDDPDGDIMNYSWDFGDGTNSTEQNPTHTFDEEGTYSVTLTVTDNEGATDDTTIQITLEEEEEASYLLPILAIIILIIVAIIVVLIWRRQKES